MSRENPNITKTDPRGGLPPAAGKACEKLVATSFSLNQKPRQYTLMPLHPISHI